MKFDLHTHHVRCGHAVSNIEEYVTAAIKAGLQVVGISDHSPYFAKDEDQAQPLIAMAKSEFPHYVKEVLQLKEKFADKIEVLLGVESDFFPEDTAIYIQEYNKYPFDYIIGSVHATRGISIFNKKRWKGLDEQRKIEEKDHYYDLIEQSAKSGMFQILGHIDAMKGFYPEFADIPSNRIEPALKVIGECGVSIEINTSGKMKYVGGWYPSDEILEKALHYGVDVTFGSDAHDPNRVGDEWELVGKHLKEIGFKDWVFYRQKQAVRVPL
jgi:histidinol-phosphatase (PHP family)